MRPSSSTLDRRLPRSDAPGRSAPAMPERLRRFLSCYWLRPENALWMALRSEVLDDYVFAPPSLDLSCGDGLFSFLHAGGRLDEDFDVFASVGPLEPVRGRHADIFDHFDENYAPRVVSPPLWRITTGTDLKPALLAKAARLDFYGELVRADHNVELRLEPARYQTIFGNSIYWVRNIERHLADIRRVAASGATVLLQVKLEAMLSYTLSAHRKVLGEAWLDLIGRGRFECWPTMGDESWWRRRFEGAGFEVREVVPFITRTHAHIWDIGLRPIAPLLVRMATAIDPTTRRSIKRDWVELMIELLLPFGRRDIDLFATPSAPAEVLFVLASP